MAPPEIDRTREESLSLSTDYADLCNRSFQASMTGHSFCCERARIKLRAACLSGGVREVARSLDANAFVSVGRWRKMGVACWANGARGFPEQLDECQCMTSRCCFRLRRRSIRRL